jgi:hypothetical protein
VTGPGQRLKVIEGGDERPKPGVGWPVLRRWLIGIGLVWAAWLLLAGVAFAIYWLVGAVT